MRDRSETETNENEKAVATAVAAAGDSGTRQNHGLSVLADWLVQFQCASCY